MKRTFIMTLTFALLLVCQDVLAHDNDLDLKKALAQKIGRHVDSVNEFEGMYEVTSGGKIYYVSHGLDRLFVGNIYDLNTKISLTAEKVKKINIINFNDLPLQDAIKTVRGNGAKSIAIFSDPNCTFCKKQEEELKDIENVTIYRFIYPILSDDSMSKARDIWCSKNQEESWEKWMVEKVSPSSNDCASPNERNILLAKKLNIQGTPTIFFQGGQRLVGFQKNSEIYKNMETRLIVHQQKERMQK